jgi:hypothetical protein
MKNQDVEPVKAFQFKSFKQWGFQIWFILTSNMLSKMKFFGFKTYINITLPCILSNKYV